MNFNIGPFELIYKETYNTNSEAKKREYYLKSLKSRKAIEKLIKAP
ncbi:MAG TPA: GIY-YIG nuclease family protein [Patescibacteria group bacterium]|nr:GIY-YIG nuclease family protein [Patescibacteria group bacterium]